MDKALRTIREEIRKNREGIIPTLTLVIDTNILADHAWARDSNVTQLIEEISFVKLVGNALEGESNVLFLTKDSDFDVERVTKELRETNVEIYFNSGACLQRIKEVVEHKR